MRRADREIKDRAELIDILERADACHLALADGTEPYLVTLNFGFAWTSDNPVLYFHCANAGRKLDIIGNNPRTCFSVDIDHVLVEGGNGCDWGMKFKSVVGQGRIEVVKDPNEREKGLQLLMAHSSRRAGFRFEAKVLAMTTVLKLTVDELTGKKRA